MMNIEEMNMDYEGVEVPDYYGEDGLLHCGVCHEPKEAYLPEGKEWLGRRTHPSMCLCRRTENERMEQRMKQLEHEQEVSRLRTKCFTDKYMNNWTFENDNGLNPKMKEARDYVVNWEEKEKENNGLLFWGGVGTGKSYMVGCITNALLEQEVSVLMTNFATILNDLNSHYADRNEYIQSLCRNRLLIIDDLDMERGTDYGLEQVYNVIDARYCSNKPLIITTNLTLNEMQNETNIARKRIYDRVLAMCMPMQIQGTHMRKIERENKRKRYLEDKK